VPPPTAALFYDLMPKKTVTISSQPERRERDLQELFRRAGKHVALFIDDAHDLHPKTLVALKRLIDELRRPKMEEIGDRPTVFEFDGLRDRQRDYIDWVYKASLNEHVMPDDVVTDEAATIVPAKLKRPLQIGQHLVRAFEAGSKPAAKPIDTSVVAAILSRQLETLSRN
jgi:type II secretory pathway predicted ATPase ExeA